MSKWLVVFIFLTITQVQAQTQPLEFRFGYEGYLLGERHEVYTFDQRAEFKWLINDAKIILRPRIVSYKNENDSDTDFNLTDAFYEQYVTERIFTTTGLQVYQWGPAEVLNPSNPFFHFNADQRSFVYKEKGKALLRLNWNTKSENNFVFIVEPVSNNETYWIAEEKFKTQLAAKYEKSWSGTRNFLGLAMGIPDNADFFLGEYFQYEFFDGFTVYADSKHSVNTFFYEPQIQTGFQRMLPSQQSGEWSTLAVLGMRYEDDFDARLEFIHNSIGYDQQQFDNALIATSQLTPYLLQNISRLQSPGLELLTQNYLYFSLRKTDPFSIKDLSLYFRSITSVMDQSGVEQFEFDKSVLDWANIFGQYSLYRGKDNTEFKLANDWKASLGIKAVY